MASKLLAIQVLLCSLLATGYTMDQATERSIRAKIRTMIWNDVGDGREGPGNYRMLAGLLRLAFHDCVGKKCDGCINMDNEDNAGLDIYINQAETLYKTLKKNGKPIMSRADFWALCGIEAVAAASEFGGCRRCKKEYPPLKFQTGRKDCVGKPKGSPWTDDVHKFPNPLGTTKETTDWFKKQYGFSYMQTVAIMGAHTLGQAHREASGFARPWVERRNRFDNEYYKVMLDSSKDWKQVSIGRRRSQKWQWESSGDRQLMMLNCDMALLKNLTDVSSTGQVRGCKYNTCALVQNPAATTAHWVKEYAKDNSLFLKQFGKAFQKMISLGYDKLDDVTSSDADVVG